MGTSSCFHVTQVEEIKRIIGEAMYENEVVGPNGSPVSGGWRSYARYEAAAKIVGSSSHNGYPYNQSTGLSTSDITTTIKAEMEAPFAAVRLVLLNRSTSALTGNTAVVGVTETSDTSTSQKMGSPTIGGTSYQQIAPSATVNGWQSVTWGGSSSVTVDAATAGQKFALSDWVPLSSIPRADGGSRPFLMWRTWRAGAAGGSWSFNTSGTGSRTPSTPMRNRVVQVSNAYSDAVTTLTATVSLTTTVQPVFPVLRFLVPVFSVWGIGDSTLQGAAQAEEGFSTWGHRACCDVSTTEVPVVWANFGAAGQKSWVALQIARAALEAGVPAPSCVVVQVASVNDPTVSAQPTAEQRQRQMANLGEVLALAQTYKIGYVIVAPHAPHNPLTLSYDNFRKATNEIIAASAAENGVRVLDFSALGDGASPERWIAGYNDGTGAAGDGIHPDADAFENVMAPALRSALASILV